jgi:formiminotetrahydrofolate cyclodeaminase
LINLTDITDTEFVHKMKQACMALQSEARTLLDGIAAEVEERIT